jgi:hypothetical protein
VGLVSNVSEIVSVSVSVSVSLSNKKNAQKVGKERITLISGASFSAPGAAVEENTPPGKEEEEEEEEVFNDTVIVIFIILQRDPCFMSRVDNQNACICVYAYTHKGIFFQKMGGRGGGGGQELPVASLEGGGGIFVLPGATFVKSGTRTSTKEVFVVRPRVFVCVFFLGGGGGGREGDLCLLKRWGREYLLYYLMYVLI